MYENLNIILSRILDVLLSFIMFNETFLLALTLKSHLMSKTIKIFCAFVGFGFTKDIFQDYNIELKNNDSL